MLSVRVGVVVRIMRTLFLVLLHIFYEAFGWRKKTRQDACAEDPHAVAQSKVFYV